MMLSNGAVPLQRTHCDENEDGHERYGTTKDMPTQQARHLLSQLRSVSLKSQIRLTPDVKHSICKRCHSMLISGLTSSQFIQNASRSGQKPWANILVVTCDFCGAMKRFPVSHKQGDSDPKAYEGK